MMHNISYCLNMDTADVSLDQQDTQISQDQGSKEHNGGPSALKGVIDGMTGFLSQRSKASQNPVDYPVDD